MPVVAVGLITDFDQAEAIVGTGDADLIALARAILYDPRWPWHAAAHFGASVAAPQPVPALAAVALPHAVRSAPAIIAAEAQPYPSRSSERERTRRRHAAAAGARGRRPGHAGRPAAGLRRAAPPGRALPAARAPRSHPAADRAGPRGLPAAGRAGSRAVAQPRPLHGRRRAADAPRSWSITPATNHAQKRGGARHARLDRRRRSGPRRAVGRHLRPRRGADEAGGARPAPGARSSSCASSAASPSRKWASCCRCRRRRSSASGSMARAWLHRELQSTPMTAPPRLGPASRTSSSRPSTCPRRIAPPSSTPPAPATTRCAAKSNRCLRAHEDGRQSAPDQRLRRYGRIARGRGHRGRARGPPGRSVSRRPARSGHGGMGTVYRAVRADAAVRQAGRAQGDQARHGHRRHAAPVPGRAADARPARSSEHRAAARRRQHRRRPAVLRHGVRRGRADRRLLRRANGSRSASALRLFQHGVRSGAARAPEPGRPSRPQAGQHPGRRRRNRRSCSTSASPRCWCPRRARGPATRRPRPAWSIAG